MSLSKPETIHPLLSSGLLGVLSGLLLLVQRSESSLLGIEGYYGQMAREMLASGQWLVPMLLGSPVFAQPPLLLWLIELSYQVGGIHEGSVRATSWLAGLLTVQLTFWLGREWLTNRVAFWGALILCEMVLWFSGGRVAGPDMVFTSLMLVGLGCLVQAGKQGLRLVALGWGLTVGLGLLLKGVWVLVAVVAVLPYLWLHNRRHQLLQNPYLYLGLGLGLWMFGLWLWAAYQGYGPVVYEAWLMPTGGADPLYYFWTLPLYTFPWAFFALGGLIVLIQANPNRFLVLWSYPALIFLLLQIKGNKVPEDLLPLAPWVALLAAAYLDYLTQSDTLRRNMMSLRLISLGLGLVALGCLGVALILYVTPQRWLEAAPYWPLGLVLGGMWCLPLVVWVWQRWFWNWQSLWVATLLLGPLATLLAVILLTEVGNYNSAFKQFSKQWPEGITGPVDLVREGTEEFALAFYTPQPGWLLEPDQIQPGRWWLGPQTRQTLDQRGYRFQILGQAGDWTLAQSP
ncbi:glycosyltransferase family 39 protein [Candidatus Cyanaurora vandensis]|uniref:ArnT family glycosyltransferase n=1 Tax=Candidatus Cyanaurora vandensis TaxID=2714958 RepID=UPI00257EA8C1|nr:glycosyltransferase family 39 protein [Candidatus Cyanaurora vandensis]